ncbi:MAG: DedA family protein, partial [Syntrophorhabdus sp.]
QIPGLGIILRFWRKIQAITSAGEVPGQVMEAYIAKYGYIGIFAGTFLEGETTVLLGGIFSRLGYMNIFWVMFYAFAGTLAGDCTFFAIGRRFGQKIINRWEFIRHKVPLANNIIKRYGNFIIFVIRFLVGIRAVVLILLGCTNMRISRFFMYSILNSICWSLLVGTIGYLFGRVVFVFVDDIKKYETIIVPVVLGAAVAFILIYRYIVNKKERETFGDQ